MTFPHELCFDITSSFALLLHKEYLLGSRLIQDLKMKKEDGMKRELLVILILLQNFKTQ